MASAERQTANVSNKGHGRQEHRTLTSTVGLNKFLEWPDLAQAFKLVRQQKVAGITKTETVYGITSLLREKANAHQLLQFVRSHWMIENAVFYVRDVTMGEDHCRVRTGAAPIVLAALRNAAINLLNAAGITNKAAALRRHAAISDEALALIRGFS